MICNKCGNQIPDNSAVCPNCGTPVSGGTQVPFGGAAGNGAKVAFFQQQSESINLIALVIAVVGLICVFPAKVWAEIWGFRASVSILMSDGKIHYGIYMIALFAVTGVLLVLKKTNSAVIPVALNAIFSLAKMIQEVTSGESGVKTGVNWAFWLVIILSILDVVAILILPKLMAKKNENPMM